MQLLNDIKDSWNNLGGNNVIDSFQQRWYEWDINDTIEWFKFTLNTKNLNLFGNNDDDNDNAYQIEDYSSSSDDNSSCDNIDEDDEKQMLETIEPLDFEYIKSKLLSTEFNSKKYFPILLKPFQFKQFGFKNEKDQKFLCNKVKKLIEKYPKQKKQSKNKRKNNKQPEKRSKNNVNEFELEGFVQDTN